MAKIIQFEEAGETAIGEPEGVKPTESYIHPEYGRIVLNLEDAPVVAAKESGAIRAKREDEWTRTFPKETRSAGVPGHVSRSIGFMARPENNFKVLYKLG